MFPDDVVGFVIQGVHIIEVDSPVIQTVAVFVVCHEPRQCPCDLSVHLDSVNLTIAKDPSNGIPDVCGFGSLPRVAAEIRKILRVDFGNFTVGQWYQASAAFFFLV